VQPGAGPRRSASRSGPAVKWQSGPRLLRPCSACWPCFCVLLFIDRAGASLFVPLCPLRFGFFQMGACVFVLSSSTRPVLFPLDSGRKRTMRIPQPTRREERFDRFSQRLPAVLERSWDFPKLLLLGRTPSSPCLIHCAASGPDWPRTFSFQSFSRRTSRFNALCGRMAPRGRDRGPCVQNVLASITR